MFRDKLRPDPDAGTVIAMIETSLVNIIAQEQRAIIWALH